MPVFDRQIASAKRMISKYGEIVIWRKILSAIPDPDKPWLTVKGANVEYKVKVAFLPVDYKNQQFKRYNFESDIATGSIAGYMGQVDFEPSLTDTVIRNGKQLVIKNIDILNPNGEEILNVMEFVP